MMKKIVLAAAILIVCVIVYSIGFVRGKNIALQRVYAEGKNAEAEIALGQYTIYRDLAKHIRANQLSDALCSVSIGASSSLDDIKACLADGNCAQLISGKVAEVAPEIVEKAPLPFEYLKSKNGIRSCIP